ncbi:MAG: hypothetical protein ACJ8AI_07335 [Rhodopila sp.]
MRDAIQRLSLSDHKLGYRPITVLLKREGWVVNHTRVERIRWSDNLLCLRQRSFHQSLLADVSATPSQAATKLGFPAPHEPPAPAAAIVWLCRRRKATGCGWPHQPAYAPRVPPVSPTEARPGTGGRSRRHSARRGKPDSVPPVRSPDRTAGPAAAAAHPPGPRCRRCSWRP